MKDILPNDRNTTGENTFVRVVLTGTDKNLYTGIGVLLSKKDSVYTVGFNFLVTHRGSNFYDYTGTIIDSIELNEHEIVEMEQIEERTIPVLE